MSMYKLKGMGQFVVKPLMSILTRVHPNHITWGSLFFAMGAGYCFYRSDLRWTLLLGPVFILLRMGCNLLDGMVARAREMCSSKGEALQEAIDRLADLAILSGVIFSPFGNVMLGIFTIAAVLFSSYLGILKKAVGGKREFGGVSGKVDRLVLIMIFSITQFLLPNKILDHFVYTYLIAILLIGGLITISQRALSIKRMQL